MMSRTTFRSNVPEASPDVSSIIMRRSSSDRRSCKNERRQDRNPRKVSSWWREGKDRDEE